ncbi:MAG: hypothetical protein IBX56_12395 [Methylomicrobium sp.]|nr:hypothetical protein [Methylomicrobium sp.]
MDDMPAVVDMLCENDREFFLERVAIMIEDGGLDEDAAVNASLRLLFMCSSAARLIYG